MPYVSQYVHKYAEHIMNLPDHMGHVRVPSLNLDQLPIIKQIHRWGIWGCIAGVHAGAVAGMYGAFRVLCTAHLRPPPKDAISHRTRVQKHRAFLKPWVKKHCPVQLSQCLAVVVLL